MRTPNASYLRPTTRATNFPPLPRHRFPFSPLASQDTHTRRPKPTRKRGGEGHDTNIPTAKARATLPSSRRRSTPTSITRHVRPTLSPSFRRALEAALFQCSIPTPMARRSLTLCRVTLQVRSAPDGAQCAYARGAPTRPSGSTLLQIRTTCSLLRHRHATTAATGGGQRVRSGTRSRTQWLWCPLGWMSQGRTRTNRAGGAIRTWNWGSGCFDMIAFIFFSFSFNHRFS